MGLVKKASRLLGVRRRKNECKVSLAVNDKENDVPDQSQGKLRRFIAAQKVRRQRRGRVEAADEAPLAYANPTTTMAQGIVLTHDTSTRQTEYFSKTRAMTDTQRIQIVEDEDDEEDDEDEEEDGNRIVYDDSESENEVDESVAEDMRKLEENFKGISQKYRLINRIGEGTFSTVYKAEQLPPPEEDSEDALDDDCYPEDHDENDHPVKRRKLSSSQPPTPRPRLPRPKPQYVALKKIYVTSSPHRIQNELEILHALRSSPHICPLLTAFRHLDQVVAVLPYFRHLDFRLYYREFIVSDMRDYFHSLLSALHSVHRAGIIHRDIKPTNFLYDHCKQRGVLVDFGLAEKQGTDWQPCLCLEPRDSRKDRYLSSLAFANQQQQQQQQQSHTGTGTGTGLSAGYPKNDTRPSRRANRAGTRGFRAPEVLLKCTSQTTKIDIWSTGVILLTLLARRFPFFNSTDDVDAMIEMASLFGRKRMKVCAAMHGSVFETNIETIGDRGFSFERIVVWASCRDKVKQPLSAGEEQAIGFLEGLLDLDPGRRWSAKEALAHEFFTRPEVEEVEVEDQGGERQGEREGEREKER